MNAMVLVFLGGGLGSVARYAVNLAAGRTFGTTFPWGIMGINIAGSLLMGLLVGWLGARATGFDAATRLFVATGVLGGFTTFSTFSLDAVTLWERGAQGAAIAYVAASVLVALVALTIGLVAGRALG
jgi:CrcB protein